MSNTLIAKSLPQASPTAAQPTRHNARTTTSSAAGIQELPVLKLSLPFLVLQTSMCAVSSVMRITIALLSPTRLPPVPCGGHSTGSSQPRRRTRSSGSALLLLVLLHQSVGMNLKVSSL